MMTRSTPGPRSNRRDVSWQLVLAVVVAIAALTTLLLGAVLAVAPATWTDAVEQYGLMIAIVVFVVVGVRIVAHSPRHTVGWLLLSIGLALASSAFGGDHTAHLAHRLPAWVLHLTAAGWFGTGGGLVLLLMVMPTGRLLSPIWRLPVVSLATALAIVAVAGLSAPVLVPSGRPNPWSLPAVHAVADALAGGVVPVAPVLLVLGAVGGIASLVVRYRGATGVERQQLKWLLFGGALFVLAFVTGISALVGLGFAALPVCCGIAIVRHGLFDIDRVVSRTVAYVVITALLLGCYAVGVVVLRAVLAPLAPDSALAVAGSTLAVAALFRPVRARVQTLIDRRFHRAHYDAQRVEARFGQRLRDEVDLDHVAAELVTAARRTVAPSGASVWLAPAPTTPAPASTPAPADHARTPDDVRAREDAAVP